MFRKEHSCDMSVHYHNCLDYVIPFLSEESVAMDVGCNINHIVERDNAVWVEDWNDDFTLLFMDRFPKSKCYAIEPLHWQEFEKRWEGDQRIDLLKFGLSDKDGPELIFYPGERHVLSSFYVQDDFLGEPLNTHKIPCKKLDTLFEELNLECIDYLKVDAEGAELKIIAGSQELLKDKKIRFVQFEYGLPDPNIPPVHLITEILEKHGYKEVMTSGREKLWTFEDV